MKGAFPVGSICLHEDGRKKEEKRAAERSKISHRKRNNRELLHIHIHFTITKEDSLLHHLTKLLFLLPNIHTNKFVILKPQTVFTN